MSSTALPKEKVEQAIDRLQPDLRRLARRWFHRTHDGQPYPYRHSSEQHARQNPDFGVTNEQRALMFELKSEGCSFREIEEIMHLYPESGNDAYRAVKHWERLLSEGRAPKVSFRFKRTPRFNAGQLKRMVALVPKTTKEKAEYRMICRLMEENVKKTEETEAVTV